MKKPSQTYQCILNRVSSSKSSEREGAPRTATGSPKTKRCYLKTGWKRKNRVSDLGQSRRKQPEEEIKDIKKGHTEIHSTHAHVLAHMHTQRQQGREKDSRETEDVRRGSKSRLCPDRGNREWSKQKDSKMEDENECSF